MAWEDVDPDEISPSQLGPQLTQGWEDTTSEKEESHSTAKNFLRGAWTVAKTIGQMAKQSVLPLAGAGVGAAAGAATGIFAPGAIPALASAGAMAGELANQKLGISPESPMQIPLEGATALIGRTGSMGRQTIKSLRKQPFEQAESIGERMLAQPGKIHPTGEAGKDIIDNLYEAVRAKHPIITADNFEKTVNKYVSEQAKISAGNKNDSLYKLVHGLQEKLEASGGQLEFQDYWKELKAMWAKKGGIPESVLKDLHQAAMKDLEAHAAAETDNGVKAALDLANNAFRRNMAAEELENVIKRRGLGKPRRGLPEAGGGLREPNPGALLKWLEDPKASKTFRENITPKEIEALKADWMEWNKLPKLSPEAGAKYGSGSILRKLAGYEIGRQVGESATGSRGAGMAIGIGVGVGTAMLDPILRKRVSQAIKDGAIKSSGDLEKVLIFFSQGANLRDKKKVDMSETDKTWENLERASSPFKDVLPGTDWSAR